MVEALLKERDGRNEDQDQLVAPLPRLNNALSI